jgi:trimethylamine corrinoid protein
MENVVTAYYNALFDTDRIRALAVIDEALAAGMAPERIIFEVVVPTMELMIGGMTDNQIITLSQHFLASQIAEEVTDLLIPRFTQAPEMQGLVVIGTSHGDFHGLGKKIVSGCLRARMFQVIDLGINVPPERFVAAALESGAKVIGISSMMVHTAIGERGPKRVRALLREQGLEQRIKLIVGGAPYRYNDELFREVGADGWADSAAEAPALIARLLREMAP